MKVRIDRDVVADVMGRLGLGYEAVRDPPLGATPDARKAHEPSSPSPELVIQ
jgi:hypothetical protein